MAASFNPRYNTKTYVKPKVTVDVIKLNSFKQEHLEQYQKCVYKPNFPTLFGDELTPELKFVKDDIIDIVDIERNKYAGTQVYRAGGTNPKKPNIARNIYRNGFKLGYPAIALFRDKDGKLYIITGHTRIEILEEDWGFTNVIVSIYEANNGYTQKQVQSALSLNGNIFNTIHDDAGQLELSDINREVTLAIENEWIGHTYTEINDRVLKSRGSGLFTTTKLSEQAQRIFNNYNPNETVLNWKNDSKTVSRMGDYGFKKIHTRSAHYEDDNGNKYILVSTQTGPKSLASILEFAKDNDITNVILHTGILETDDLIKCYNDRVKGFTDFYKTTLERLSKLFFSAKEPIHERVKIKGVVPSLSSIHNLDELVLFDEKGNMYQINQTKKHKKAA